MPAADHGVVRRIASEMLATALPDGEAQQCGRRPAGLRASELDAFAGLEWEASSDGQSS
jgi:hypothetical protein